MTFEYGAILISVFSAVAMFFWVKIQSPIFRWYLVLGAPLVFSYCLYWSPVWFAADHLEHLDRVEYAHWAPLFISLWYVIGALLSVIINVILKIKKDPRRK